MNNNDILQDIKYYSELGKLSIFIGAGVSKLSGLPSWWDLIVNMADDIGYSYNIDKNGKAHFSSEEYLKIPQMYFIEKGKELYKKKVINDIGKPVEPNEIHDLIMSLNPTNILTTNYDTLIEQSAIKFGKNYSVINSNKNVSNAKTNHYIIKVHGDFSSEFVLKEQDYLDYEKNFILIDNIVKTVFATNLVIFIGYGLNDYNIKLILNWVKNVQSDSFVKPIFIHTGERLNELEIKYYHDSRSIRVLDCNDFTSNKDYLTKYKEVIENILQYNEKERFSNKTEILDYIYNKIKDLKNISYLRREDFKNIFNNKYFIDDQYKIVQINKIENDIFKDVLENHKQYKKIDETKYEFIICFLKKCLVKCLESDPNFYNLNIHINDSAFYNEFEKIMKFCRQDYSDLKNKYKKAYYLAQLGNYEESYRLYNDLLIKAQFEEQWDIYYFSQLNRKYLFSIIRSTISNCKNPATILTFLREIKPFSDEFINKINIEMKNFKLEEQFLQLPYDFKQKYKFLEVFSQDNCYHKKYYNLLNKKYEVEKTFRENYYTLYFGLSKFDDIKLEMLEMTKFFYDNFLLFPCFTEHKVFVKNTLIAWLKAFEKEKNKDKEFSLSHINNSRCDFTLEDIINISKCFNEKDIDYLLYEVNFNRIPFKQNNELSNYVVKQIKNYQLMFNKTINDTEMIFVSNYSNEIKNLLMISSYYIKDKVEVQLIIDFIININNIFFRNNLKINLINKWLKNTNSKSIRIKIEHWLKEIIRSKEW